MKKIPKFTIDVQAMLALEGDVNVYLTDANHHIVAINDSMLKIANDITADQHKNNIIGKSLYDVLDNQDNLELVIQENESVIKSKKPKSFLNLLIIERHYSLNMLTLKMPVYDENGNIYVLGFSHHIEKISEKNARLSGLTKIEFECLLGLMDGKTYKEIAAELKRSPRTIEHKIENIKSKFGVAHKSELTKKVETSNIRKNVLANASINQMFVSIPLAKIEKI